MICPVCGNSDFHDIRTAEPFLCPVPGCAYAFRPGRPARIILHGGEEGDWCPVCGQAVNRGDRTCPAGDPLNWCPVCGGVLADGVCGEGHRFVFCPYCMMNVQDRCAIHSGAAAPYRPGVKVRGYL